MTRIALITTTINVPHVLTQWAESGMNEEDVIIVAGDHKSPHKEIAELLNDIWLEHKIRCLYLDPDNQTQWAMSEITGWNCIQRRNIALLEAMKFNPEYILTVDDDNAPVHQDQITRLVDIMEYQVHSNDVSLQSESGWFNPGVLCNPPVIHRGYPLSRRREFASYTYKGIDDKIGVIAMLWTGEPDIDAIERMVNAPIVDSISHPSAVRLKSGTWAPFNSQATMYRGELAPLMMVWPGVGRYDDIWASYLARRVMDHLGYSVYYGVPEVHQDRNEHDLMKDLEAEMFGMKHNEEIIQQLRTTTFSSNDTLYEALLHTYGLLMRSDILPEQTCRSFNAWIKDLRTIGYDIK